MKTIEQFAKEYAESKSSLEVFKRSHIEDVISGVEFAQKWHDVNEELPPINGKNEFSKISLIKFKNNAYTLGVYCKSGYWLVNGSLVFNVTHWRPIELK